MCPLNASSKRSSQHINHKASPNNTKPPAPKYTPNSHMVKEVITVVYSVTGQHAFQCDPSYPSFNPLNMCIMCIILVAVESEELFFNAW